MTPRRSVFLEALRADASKLRPEVYEYVAGPPLTPASANPRGVGEGVFELAGSKFGALMALLRPFLGPDLLVTRNERDVSFRIVNTPTVTDDGSVQLAATRTFQFRTGDQQFRDVLVAAGAPGVLLNHLGSKRRLTLVLHCAVSPQGHLLITSDSAHLRIGRGQIKLPRLLSVAAHVEDGYDSERQRRTVNVVVKNPIVGVVMQYRGWFQYRYVSD